MMILLLETVTIVLLKMGHKGVIWQENMKNLHINMDGELRRNNGVFTGIIN